MARCLLLAVVLAGCRQLLGFEDLGTATDAPGEVRTVRFRLTRNNLECDPTGRPIAVAQAPSLEGVAVRVEGNVAALSLDGIDLTFDAPAGATYQIALDTAEGPVELQTAADAPVFDEIIFARADQQAVTEGTIFEYSNIGQAGLGYFVMSTGVWAISPETSADAVTKLVKTPWSTATTLSGAPIGLLDSTRNDRIHLGHYVSSSSETTGDQARLNRFQDDLVLPKNGETTTIAGAQGDPATGQLQLTANFVTIDARVATVPGFTDPRWRYFVLATPHPTTHPDRGFKLLTLDQGSLGFGHSNFLSFPVETFPFATTGHSQLQRARSAQGPEGPLKLTVTSTHFDALLDVGPITIPGAATRVGVTGLPSLGGVALTADDVTVELPGNLTWTGDQPVDMYVVRLFDLARTEPQLVKTYYTTEPNLIVDDVGAGTYFFNIRSVLGYPSAGAGDFTTGTLPQDWFEVDSGLFRVAN